MKQDVVEFLKSKEKDGMTWTVICCGMFFDWSLANNHMQFNVPEHRYTIFSDGTHPFVGTTLSQIVCSIPAILSAAHVAETANRYIYISSFSSQGPVNAEPRPEFLGARLRLAIRTHQEHCQRARGVRAGEDGQRPGDGGLGRDCLCVCLWVWRIE
jgi:hypothetical protein